MASERGLTGLFLGAGASYEVGMPLVWEITSQFTTSLTTEKLRTFNSTWRANPQLTRALQALRDDARPLRDALIGKRLWLGRGQAWCARLAGAAPLLTLWLVGLRKIQIGLQLQRLVGFLVAAMVVVTLVALGCLLTPPRRNLAGERLLAERDAALLTDAGPRHTAQALDLAQPLALAGTGMLLGTPWADYHSLRAPIASGSGGSGCSSSGCGGGGGGGGGGCSSGCGGCGGGS
jgi:uncharacterized membrane protein YgcG